MQLEEQRGIILYLNEKDFILAGGKKIALTSVLSLCASYSLNVLNFTAFSLEFSLFELLYAYFELLYAYLKLIA